MDGLLIVDKPAGPTSHDVVARVRHALGERHVGHTGTLDPIASGVLPLVVGRATRLVRFLDGDKQYDAVIRFGSSTDTGDRLGETVGPAVEGPWPSPSDVEAALAGFRGTILQQPPAYSAKKIGGRRSYRLARRTKAAGDGDEPPLPAPATVTAYSLRLVNLDGALARVHMHCSSGFYVRSLAHDLGQVLGVGAHLSDLRRTEAAGFGLDRAVLLEALERDPSTATAALISIDGMLPGLPAVALTASGVAHARSGRNLGPGDAIDGFEEAVAEAHGASARVRLVDPAGHLVAMAQAANAPGLLHAFVVLM
jgi:tRNA pseudouridine55 synthase